MPLAKSQWHLYRFAIMVPVVGVEPSDTFFLTEKIAIFCSVSEKITGFLPVFFGG